MTPDKQLLIATNRVFEEEVVSKGDFGALSRVYTRGARVMPPGSETITGSANIEEFWRQTAVALKVTGIRLEQVEVEFTGDAAVEIGRAVIATAESPVEVKYVVVWKAEDGVWKWDIDIWNAVS